MIRFTPEIASGVRLRFFRVRVELDPPDPCRVRFPQRIRLFFNQLIAALWAAIASGELVQRNGWIDRVKGVNFWANRRIK